MSLVLRYYEGETETQHRRALFNSADPGFEPMRDASGKEALHSLDLQELLRGWSDESPLVLFIHYTKFQDVTDKMADWSTDVQRKGVVVFYSGAGVTREQAESLKRCADLAGMHGRVYVHYTDFGRYRLLTVEGIRRFVAKLLHFRAGDEAEWPNGWDADVFGWWAISEHAHRQYAMGIMSALLPHMFSGSARRPRIAEALNLLDELEAAKRNAVEYVGEARPDLIAAIDGCWVTLAAIFPHRAAPYGEQLNSLRDLLLGGDSRSGLVDLLDEAWKVKR